MLVWVVLVWVVINHADDYGVTLKYQKADSLTTVLRLSGLSREATTAYDSDAYWSHRIITM